MTIDPDRDPRPLPPATTPTSGLAVGSLICSVLGWVTFGVTAILGVILGHLALPHTRSGRAGGHGLAVAGLIIGYIPIAGWVLVLWLLLG